MAAVQISLAAGPQLWALLGRMPCLNLGLICYWSEMRSSVAMDWLYQKLFLSLFLYGLVNIFAREPLIGPQRASIKALLQGPSLAYSLWLGWVMICVWRGWLTLQLEAVGLGRFLVNHDNCWTPIRNV